MHIDIAVPSKYQQGKGQESKCADIFWGILEQYMYKDAYLLKLTYFIVPPIHKVFRESLRS